MRQSVLIKSKRSSVSSRRIVKMMLHAFRMPLGDENRPQLNEIIPTNPNQPYDMREVISGITDENSFFEVHKNFAENIVVGFARLAGRSIGIVGNQRHLWRVYSISTECERCALFVRFLRFVQHPIVST